MQKDDQVYTGHMLDMAEKALDLVRGKERQDYNSDETLRFALAHLIQVIGQAARHVSKDFCSAHPEVPWKAIIGMRHKGVHDYMNVDEDVVWDTVVKERPSLVTELKRIVSPV